MDDRMNVEAAGWYGVEAGRALDKTLRSVWANAGQCLCLRCAGFAETLGSLWVSKRQ